MEINEETETATCPCLTGGTGMDCSSCPLACSVKAVSMDWGVITA